MKKALAILLDLGKGLDIPKDKLDELQALVDSDASDINEADIASVFKKGLVDKLSAISKNASFDKKKIQDEAYKSAERKIKSGVEETLKEKFNIEVEEGDTLETIVEKAAATTAGNSSDTLTDDVVKKHKLFLQMENAHKKTIKEMEAAHKQAIQEVEVRYQTENVLNDVAKLGLTMFESMKPILSSDPEKAKSQRALVEKLIREGKYQKMDDGSYLPLDKDGNRLEDEYKNAISLEQHIKNLTGAIFDFKVAEDRDSPNSQQGNGGNPPAPAAGFKSYTGKLPTNQKELNDIIFNKALPIEQRQEVQAWSEKNELPE